MTSAYTILHHRHSEGEDKPVLREDEEEEYGGRVEEDEDEDEDEDQQKDEDEDEEGFAEVH